MLLKLTLTPQIIRIAGDLKDFEQLHTIWRIPTNLSSNSIYITDSDSDYSFFFKTLRVSFDYQPKLRLSANDIVIPYTLHPKYFGRYRKYINVTEPTLTTRKIRMLFAGNHRKVYDNSIIRELVGKVSRYQIIAHAIEKLPVHIVSDPASLQRLMTSGQCDSIVILDQYTGLTSMKAWLQLLSQCEFFLAPPGITIPLAHNSVEAMLMGAIPWTNYEDWFIPPLIDGETCIAFNTLEDLETTFQRIISFNVTQIEQMRTNVLAYYQNHIDPSKFWARIMAHPNRELTLHMLDEQKSVLRRTLKPHS